MIPNSCRRENLHLECSAYYIIFGLNEGYFIQILYSIKQHLILLAAEE